MAGMAAMPMMGGRFPDPQFLLAMREDLNLSPDQVLSRWGFPPGRPWDFFPFPQPRNCRASGELQGIVSLPAF